MLQFLALLFDINAEHLQEVVLHFATLLLDIKVEHLQEVVLEFVAPLPDLAEADGDVEAVEDGERHGDVRDDGPGPDTVVVELGGVGVSTARLESADGPHGQVTDQEESYHFPARFPGELIVVVATAARGVQDEQGLQRGLDKGDDGGEEGQDPTRVQTEVAANDSEGGVDVGAGLGDQEQDVVQLYVPVLDKLQLSHLYHPYDYGQYRHTVHAELDDVSLQHGHGLGVLIVDEHEEEYE